MRERQMWARMWAAVKPRKAPTLRRGAWYPVVQQHEATVEIGCGADSVAVPQRLLEIRKGKPHRFTVVRRGDHDPNPLQGTKADLGTTYAVCPAGNCRIPLFGIPEEIECPTCGHRGPVGWWETS